MQSKSKARLNVSIDNDVKENVGYILNEIGMDYTTAINIYFKKIISEKKIPFELNVEKNLSVDEFLGDNWRLGLEAIEDEWE